MAEIATTEPPRRVIVRRVPAPETLVRLGAVIGFLVAWQLVVPYLPTDQIPTPLAVAGEMFDELRLQGSARTTVYASFAITLLRLAAGLALTFVLGLIVGVAMGVSRRVDALLRDFVIGGLALPYLIWALVITMWLGFTFWTPVLVVVLASIPFVITNVVEGVRDVPRDLVDMARSFSVPRAQILWQVMVPSLTPFLFAAFRYSLSMGWKALAVAEVFGATSGAGWVIRYYYDARRMEGLFAYLAFFIIVATLIDLLFLRRLDGRVSRWRRPATKD
jgi:NitT/TauT family transport system permease protein